MKWGFPDQIVRYSRTPGMSANKVARRRIGKLGPAGKHGRAHPTTHIQSVPQPAAAQEMPSLTPGRLLVRTGDHRFRSHHITAAQVVIPSWQAQIISQAWSPMCWPGTWQNFDPELLEGQKVFCRTCTGHEYVGLRLSVVCACAHARAHACMALSKSYLQRESRQI